MLLRALDLALLAQVEQEPVSYTHLDVYKRQLYASGAERPAEAGFVIGYAAHDVDVIRRGVAGLAKVFAAVA